MTQTPDPDERRQIRNLLTYWLQTCGNRAFPTLADIDPDRIADIWGNCFLLDTADNREFPFFQYLGPSLAKYSGVLLSGKTDWAMTLLDKAVHNFKEAVEKRVPIMVEDSLARYDGRVILFRSVMLPLSDDGKTVNYILGAANGRIAEE
jgi:hypothetical protein